MDAIKNPISNIESGWLSVSEIDVRQGSADYIVGNAQITANQWGNRSDTLLTCMLSYWMFSFIAAYSAMTMLKFAAAVSTYKASEGIVASPFAKPAAATADVVARTTAATASLATGLFKAQFEGENPRYRPSLGDVGRSIVDTGVTNLVFSPKTAMVGA